METIVIVQSKVREKTGPGNPTSNPYLYTVKQWLVHKRNRECGRVKLLFVNNSYVHSNKNWKTSHVFFIILIMIKSTIKLLFFILRNGFCRDNYYVAQLLLLLFWNRIFLCTLIVIRNAIMWHDSCTMLFPLISFKYFFYYNTTKRLYVMAARIRKVLQRKVNTWYRSKGLLQYTKD